MKDLQKLFLKSKREIIDLLLYQIHILKAQFSL